MARHFTFRGSLSLVSRYLPFAKKELNKLVKQRKKRGNASLSRVFRGSDGILGTIRLSSNRTEDHIHISVLGGGPVLFTEAINSPNGIDVDKIQCHVYHRRPNKFKQKNKAVLGEIFDTEPPIISAGGFWFSMPHGPYVIVQTFHGAFDSDEIIYWLMEYDGGEGVYTLQTPSAGFVDALGAPINRPADSDEVMWSAVDWPYNHYSNSLLTSYVAIARTGTPGSGFPLDDPLTITPYIVTRDLTSHIAVNEVLYTLPSFTQDQTNDIEYWSPNHPGYVSLFGIDQDRIYLTALRRNSSGGVLTTTVLLLSINLETGTVIQHDTWNFTDNNTSGTFPHRGLGSFMVLFSQDTNVIGHYEFDFGWGGTGVTFASNADVRFYAGPQEDDIGDVDLKFTLSDVDLDVADIHFWSLNNEASWEDENGDFQDNQLYGIVVFEAATGGDNSVKIYTSEGGEDPVLIKEYPATPDSPFGDLVGVRVGREFCLIIGTGGSRVYDIKYRQEKDLGAALTKSGQFGQGLLMDPIPMINAPSRYK